MRILIAIDDELLAQAQAFTGIQDNAAVIHHALKALVEFESSRRLARLGGTELDLTAIPRRRMAKA